MKNTQNKPDLSLCFENCFNIESTESEEESDWKETGKVIFMRWILPQAMVSLEEKNRDNCIHYVLTIEFSNRYSDWNAQRLNFGSQKEEAIAQAKIIVEKFSHWPTAVSFKNNV